MIEAKMVLLQEELKGYQRAVPDPESLAAAAARGDLDPDPVLVKMISDAVALGRK